jgi:hypothetical protein
MLMRPRQAAMIAAMVAVIALGLSWKLFYPGSHSPSSLSKPATSTGSGPVEVPEGGKSDIPRVQASGLPASEVVLPFVGKVATKRLSHSISVLDPHGAKIELPFKVDYTPDGRFVRAVYENPHPKEVAFPVEEVEVWYKSSAQRITGLPSKPMHISWEELLKNLRIANQLASSDRVEVTYEMFTDPNFAPRPVIIVCILGVRESVLQGSGEPIVRVRYVFGEKGELIFVDNAA